MFFVLFLSVSFSLEIIIYSNCSHPFILSCRQRILHFHDALLKIRAIYVHKLKSQVSVYSFLLIFILLFSKQEIENCLGMSNINCVVLKLL